MSLTPEERAETRRRWRIKNKAKLYKQHARWRSLPKNKKTRNEKLKERRRAAPKRARVRRGRSPTERRLVNLFRGARSRAKRLNREFTLDFKAIEWPEFCPVLGIKLNYDVTPRKGMSPDSPSLDRVDSNRGYTPDNVRVISNRANILKRDGTLAELEAIVNYMKEHLT